MKFIRKAAFFLTVLCLVLSLWPVTALAEDEIIPTDEYTEFTIVGWKNEGPEGAIRSVTVKGELLPETGGTVKAAPSERLEVRIELNPGYKRGDWLDGVILRFAGVQSGSDNVANSSSFTSILAPAEEWLKGVYGEDAMDHEIYLIIPTQEDESVPRYTLSFETNGGSGIDSVTAAKGSELTLSDYTTEREGYLLDGWYADAALTEKLTAVTLEGNTTVYAKWTEEPSGEENPPQEEGPESGDGDLRLWMTLAGLSLLGAAAVLLRKNRLCACGK